MAMVGRRPRSDEYSSPAAVATSLAAAGAAAGGGGGGDADVGVCGVAGVIAGDAAEMRVNNSHRALPHHHHHYSDYAQVS